MIKKYIIDITNSIYLQPLSTLLVVVGPVLRDWQINEYLQGNVNSTLLKGLEELCKERPEDPLVWLADWLLIHNPYCPRSLAVTEESVTDIVTNMSSTESTCS